MSTIPQITQRLRQYTGVLRYVTVNDLDDYVERNRSKSNDPAELQQAWHWLDVFCGDFLESYYHELQDQRLPSTLDMPLFWDQTNNRDRAAYVVKVLELPETARYFSRGDSEARFWLNIPIKRQAAVIAALCDLDRELKALYPTGKCNNWSFLRPLFYQLQVDGYTIGDGSPDGYIDPLDQEETNKLRPLFVKADRVVNPE